MSIILTILFLFIPSSNRIRRHEGTGNHTLPHPRQGSVQAHLERRLPDMAQLQVHLRRPKAPIGQNQHTGIPLPANLQRHIRHIAQEHLPAQLPLRPLPFIRYVLMTTSPNTQTNHRYII